MIRITTTGRLAALRTEAAQLPGLRGQLAEAQEQLAATETARDEATAELRRLYDGVIVDLAELKRAADDPETGPSVRGGLALSILREQITRIKQSGNVEAIGKLWLLDMIINDNAHAAPSDEQPTSNPAADTHDGVREGACGFRFHAAGTDGEFTEHVCTLDPHDDETDHCDETTDTQWDIGEECSPANQGPCSHEEADLGGDV